MSQQVWAHLSATGESWAVSDLARILEMPRPTVYGQLRRLEAAGKVQRREGKYGGKTLWKVRS